MGINRSVQYYGGFLPDIVLLLTQSYLRGTRLNTMHGLCTYNLYNSILLLHCLMVYYIVSFDGVLHCFWVVFTVFLASLHGE